MPRKIGPNYNAGEDFILRAMFLDGASDALIGEKINRTPLSVMSRRLKLGLYRERPAPAQEPLPEPPPPPSRGCAGFAYRMLAARREGLEHFTIGPNKTPGHTSNARIAPDNSVQSRDGYLWPQAEW